MNRAVLLGLAVLLCAVAWLWWSDPSRGALAEIVAEYQSPKAAPAPASDSSEARREVEPDTPSREALKTVPNLSPPQGEVVSSIQGTITGGIEVFPAGDRSGVQVYCWPGWYAKQPHRLSSLQDAPGMQVTTTDAAGNFSFDLYVDDAHWLFAVADGMCSDPEGMRIGTKPGVEVSMEMRRLVGLRYRLVIDGQARKAINFEQSRKISLVEDELSESIPGRRFPRAFFPTAEPTAGDTPLPNAGETFAWLAPQALTPAAIQFSNSLPGCHPFKETIPLEPVSRTQAMQVVELLIHPHTQMGEILLEFTGVPAIAQAPFCRALFFPFVAVDHGSSVTSFIEGFDDFPLRLHYVPVGEYRLTPEDHPQARIDLDVPETIQVQAGKTTRVLLDFSRLEFLVFERDPELEDVRYLTPPRVRIRGRGEASVTDWEIPRQVMIIQPLARNEEMLITGSVFLDGPRGPRKDGRVTVYTAGTDDD